MPPTLRLWPGDTIQLTYVNNLPVSNDYPFNVTNLHFHGLSTSPNPPADDVIDLYAMPGQTLHYVIPIPPTQPSPLSPEIMGPVASITKAMFGDIPVIPFMSTGATVCVP